MARELERGGQWQSEGHGCALRSTTIGVGRCALARVRELLPTDGPRTAPTSISITHAGAKLRMRVDDRAATEATPRAVSNAGCAERAARPRISRISMFVNFAILFSCGYIYSEEN